MSSKAYTMTDLKKAEADLVAARGRFNTVKEQIDEREFAPKRRALLGKCFRYRNSYSCPEKPSDYWWLWTRVVGLDGMSLVCVQAQRDKYGKVTIEHQMIPSFDGTISDGYMPATQRQFDLATAGMMGQAWRSINTKIKRGPT